MENVKDLDVLIVYTSNVAVSANSADTENDLPFLADSEFSNYLPAYEYFLKTAAKAGLSAGFTASVDIIGPGITKRYWTLHPDTSKWVKNEQTARSTQIFDKLSPGSMVRKAERDLLFSRSDIRSFNDQSLHATFFDKQVSYDLLTEFAIPTVSVQAHQKNFAAAAVSKLKKLVASHPHPEDFSSKIILKDRFGSSGNHVYKISHTGLTEITSIVNENPGVSFILQPFVLFDTGYIYQDNATATDIRIIFHRDVVLQSYIRMAKENEFRCNEHQGGTLVYLSPQEIPEAVLTVAQKMVEKIDKPDSLYALDFLISNSGNVYFLEGNIGPGLDWNPEIPENKVRSLQLIQSIVDEFGLRVAQKKE